MVKRPHERDGDLHRSLSPPAVDDQPAWKKLKTEKEKRGQKVEKRKKKEKRKREDEVKKRKKDEEDEQEKKEKHEKKDEEDEQKKKEKKEKKKEEEEKRTHDLAVFAPTTTTTSTSTDDPASREDGEEPERRRNGRGELVVESEKEMEKAGEAEKNTEKNTEKKTGNETKTEERKKRQQQKKEKKERKKEKNKKSLNDALDGAAPVPGSGDDGARGAVGEAEKKGPNEALSGAALLPGSKDDGPRKAAGKAEEKDLKKASDGTALVSATKDDDTRAAAAKAEKKRQKAQRKKEKASNEASTKAPSRVLIPAPIEAESRSRQATNGKPASSPTTTATEMESPMDSNAQPYREDAALSALPQADIDAFLAENFIAITDPRGPSVLRPIMSFNQLPRRSFMPLSTFSKFQQPTAIQSAAWPFLFAGRDVVGVAETGSGKTLAFGVPCITYLKSLPPPAGASGAAPAQAIMVSPTRELAVQIHEQIAALAQPAGLATACVYGGVPKPAQREALRSARIVVATPGRLNDLIDEGAADLSRVTFVVLDEADRMLDKGFEDDIRRIVAATATPARQTLMFTATWPPSIRALAASFLRAPVRIAIGDHASGELRANARIEQRIEVVDPRAKETRLLQLVRQHQSGPARHHRILVFCLYKKEAVRIESFLRAHGLRVAAIHGDLSQDRRTASLDAFKLEGGCPLLVATDVAARGLDIPAVKLVVNVTFPLTVEDYVHRIGRTGRAGAPGLAITLFTEHDKAQSGALINVLRAAGQPVPEALMRFGTTVKKKGHEAYGAFYKDTGDAPVATKIKFDD